MVGSCPAMLMSAAVKLIRQRSDGYARPPARIAWRRSPTRRAGTSARRQTPRQGERDQGLAVGPLAERPAVLARHADRARALPRQGGVVDYQAGVRSAHQATRLLGQDAPQPTIVPGRVGSEVLQLIVARQTQARAWAVGFCARRARAGHAGRAAPRCVVSCGPSRPGTALATRRGPALAHDLPPALPSSASQETTPRITQSAQVVLGDRPTRRSWDPGWQAAQLFIRWAYTDAWKCLLDMAQGRDLLWDDVS